MKNFSIFFLNFLAAFDLGIFYSRSERKKTNHCIPLKKKLAIVLFWSLIHNSTIVFTSKFDLNIPSLRSKTQSGYFETQMDAPGGAV